MLCWVLRASKGQGRGGGRQVGLFAPFPPACSGARVAAQVAAISGRSLLIMNTAFVLAIISVGAVPAGVGDLEDVDAAFCSPGS